MICHNIPTLNAYFITCIQRDITIKIFCLQVVHNREPLRSESIYKLLPCADLALYLATYSQ